MLGTDRVEEIFHTYKDELYRHALFVFGNPMDAEDALSEVFIKVLKSLDTFEGRSSIRTWVWTVMKNQCKDMLRAKRRHDTRLHPLDANTSSFVDTRFSRVLWADSFGHLKESYRQVISLRYVQGFDTNETAEILGWTESKVRVVLLRAKRQLKLELEDEPQAFVKGGSVSQ